MRSTKWYVLNVTTLYEASLKRQHESERASVTLAGAAGAGTGAGAAAAAAAAEAVLTTLAAAAAALRDYIFPPSLKATLCCAMTHASIQRGDGLSQEWTLTVRQSRPEYAANSNKLVSFFKNIGYKYGYRRIVYCQHEDNEFICKYANFADNDGLHPDKIFSAVICLSLTLF